MKYILDTNAISDYLHLFEPTVTRIRQAIRQGHTVYLASPVQYEVLRGLLKANAHRQHRVFEQEFAPQLEYLAVTEADWRTTAQYWATTRSAGKQLSDIDLLLAALALRLDAVIVSNDGDFDALPVRRENWRES
jgi:predicted nucleic acid-binding protein